MNNQKRVIIIVIALVIIIGGIFIWLYSNESKEETHIGIIEKMYQRDEKEYIDINFIKFITPEYIYGENDEQGTCNPNIELDHYCIVDDNKKIKSYVIDLNVIVIPASYPGGYIPYFCKDLNISDVAKEFTNVDDFCENGGIRTVEGLSSSIFLFKIKNGIIKEIKEVYIP